jgi:hypothetical protein
VGHCRCAKSVYRANAYTYRDTAANADAVTHSYRVANANANADGDTKAHPKAPPSSVTL